MSPESPVFDTDRVERELAGCPLGTRVLVYRETASTNDLALRLGAEGAQHGTVVLADAQTAGRGRMGRRWESGPGLGLWFSVVLRPELPEAHWPRLTLCAALAVVSGIETVAPTVRAGIKWPNDIQCEARKLAGILLESRSGKGGFVVAGIGINVHHRPEDFPPDLRAIAGSVRMLAPVAVSREELAVAVLRALAGLWGEAADGFEGIVAECERRSVLLGREVEVTAGVERLVGIATGLDPLSGGLLLRGPEGGHRVVGFGEVTRVRGAGLGPGGVG